MLEERQLSLLEIGETTKNPSIWSNYEVVIQVLDMVSLNLALNSDHFLSKIITVFLPFSSDMPSFWVKMSSHIFQNILP